MALRHVSRKSRPRKSRKSLLPKLSQLHHDRHHSSFLTNLQPQGLVHRISITTKISRIYSGSFATPSQQWRPHEAPPKSRTSPQGKWDFALIPIAQCPQLTPVSPALSKSQRSKSFVKRSNVKNQDYKPRPSGSLISKSFMSSRAGRGRNSRIMCGGTGLI